MGPVKKVNLNTPNSYLHLGDTDRHFMVISHERTKAHTNIFKLEIDLSVSDVVVMGCLPSVKLVAICEFSIDHDKIMSTRDMTVNVAQRSFYFTDDSFDNRLGFLCKRDGVVLPNEHMKCNPIRSCYFTDCVKKPYVVNCSGSIDYAEDVRPQFNRVMSIVAMAAEVILKEYFAGRNICQI